MRTILVALLLVATPVQAADCVFTSSDGWTFSVEDKAESEYRVTRPDGSHVICTWMQTDRGTGVVLGCDNGTEEFVTPSENGDVAFGGREYRRRCDQ